jgi:ribose/xylose/arabinose/galactoside ABC-type transport system permease subunit
MKETPGFDVRRMLKLLAANRVFLALAIEIIILAIFADRFFTQENIFTVLRQNAAIGIVSVGMTFVILTGGIDLSVGAVVAVAGVVSTSMVKGDWAPLSVRIMCAILGGISGGAIIGAFNGLCVTKLKVAPFVVTLSTMYIFRGLGYYGTQARTISGLPKAFFWIGQETLLRSDSPEGFPGFPVPVLIMIVVFAIGMVLLLKTTYGRHVYAIGGNPEAARLSGIRVERKLIVTYILCGMTAALAGIVGAARLGVGSSKEGQYWELDAVVAVVVGGTSLVGGRGSLWGTFLGAVFIGFLLNGMNLMQVDTFFQMVVKGVVLLAAAALDRKEGA